jgi:hypothetical protein
MKLELALCILIFFMPLGISPALGDEWPPLPRSGYIAGRVASPQDLKAGNALFVASNGDTVISTPLTLTIPQYAYWYGKGQRVRVILVQAEEAQGVRICGVRDLNGKAIVCTEAELTLLGQLFGVPECLYAATPLPTRPLLTFLTRQPCGA